MLKCICSEACWLRPATHLVSETNLGSLSSSYFFSFSKNLEDYPYFTLASQGTYFEECVMLSDTIWWTRKSRIQAAERLMSNDFHTQLILVWYSLFAVCLTIYYLKFDPQSGLAQVSMVIISIMILSMSLFMSGRNFKERSVLMKQCYLQLDSLYRKAKVIENNSDEESLERISDEYHNVIDASENHKEVDFYVSIVKFKTFR